MYIKEFLKNDILINSVETYPKYDFLISKEGSFILKNRPTIYRGGQQNELLINDFLTAPIIVEGEDILLDFSNANLSFNLTLI